MQDSSYTNIGTPRPILPRPIAKGRAGARRTPFLLAALLTLTAACTTNPDFADSLARESAKSVVSGVIATRFPRLQVAPVTDCVIDNATSSEIILIARAALTGPDAETASTIVSIAGRPETIRCIAQAGPSVLTQ